MKSLVQRAGAMAANNNNAQANDAWKLFQAQSAKLCDETGKIITTYEDFLKIVTDRNIVLNPGFTSKMENYLHSLVQGNVFLKERINYDKIPNQTSYIWRQPLMAVAVEPSTTTVSSSTTSTQPQPQQQQNVDNLDTVTINNFKLFITKTIQSNLPLAQQIYTALSTAYVTPDYIYQGTDNDVLDSVVIMKSLAAKESQKQMLDMVSAEIQGRQ